MIAVYRGHSHIVEVLVRFKPDINLQTIVSVVAYCSVSSACVSWAVSLLYNALSMVGGLDHLNALRSGIQSPSNQRVLYTRSPCLDYGIMYVC